jgi:hypothetical protein
VACYGTALASVYKISLLYAIKKIKIKTNEYYIVTKQMFANIHVLNCIFIFYSYICKTATYLIHAYLSELFSP